MPLENPLVNEVSAVLRRIPGLDLTSARSHDTRCQFEMTLNSWDALLLLAHAGYGANVRFGSYSRHSPGSKEAVADPPRAIVHQFLIDADDEPSFQKSLEALGAHLLWGMHRLGWISTEDANPALRRFRAAPVPRPMHS